MKPEWEVAVALKAKGYQYVIQITTNEQNFGEPLFLRAAIEAGPLLRSFRQDEHAKIAWTRTVDQYIKDLEVK